MRALLLLLALLGLGIFALNRWQPGAAATPSATVIPTLLPNNFTLLSTFVPSFPCELQQIEVYDEVLCRRESVQERVLAQGDEVTFIQHDFALAQGCWGTIRQDIHELRVCQPESGAVTVLTRELTSDLLPSPDKAWFAFGTLDIWNGMNPHVYRVRADGTGLQRLDAQGFPAFAVGAPGDLRWLDDDWLALTLWTGREGDYRAYRLKADGSGAYEPLPNAEVTEVG